MKKKPDKNHCKLDVIKDATEQYQNRKKSTVSKRSGWILILFAYLLGGGGMAVWGAFLFFGPFHIIDLDLGSSRRLVFNTLLCLIFFIQHSMMLRQWFRIFLTRFIPVAYHGVLYSVSSGTVLLVLVIFWQPSVRFLPRIPMLYYGISILFVVVGIAGFIWSLQALSEFDALGIAPAIRHIKGLPPDEPLAFVAQGPYLLVRHPLYFLSLLVIWAGPVTSVDRILHNILWTIWIYFGARLEEKDLVDCFGEPYKQYQASVPMLFPNFLAFKTK